MSYFLLSTDIGYVLKQTITCNDKHALWLNNQIKYLSKIEMIYRKWEYTNTTLHENLLA